MELLVDILERLDLVDEVLHAGVPRMWVDHTAGFAHTHTLLGPLSHSGFWELGEGGWGEGEKGEGESSENLLTLKSDNWIRKLSLLQPRLKAGVLPQQRLDGASLNGRGQQLLVSQPATPPSSAHLHEEHEQHQLFSLKIKCNDRVNNCLNKRLQKLRVLYNILIPQN